MEACDRALGLVGRSAYPMLDPVGPIERVDPRPLGPVGPAVDTRDGGRDTAHPLRLLDHFLDPELTCADPASNQTGLGRRKQLHGS